MTLGVAIAVALAALAAACGGSTTTVTDITAPDAVRCQTTVSTPSTIPYGGSQMTVNVVAARDCLWTANTDASWVRVSPTSGQGEAAVTLTVAENQDSRARSGALIVNDTRFTLNQEAAPCRFQLGSSQGRLSHEGGRISIAVSTSDACTWRAASSAEWARVVTDSGNGSGTVQVDVAPNTGPGRVATLSISGQSFSLTQDGRPSPGPGPAPNPIPNPGPPPPNPTCTLTLDSSERSFDPSGGDGSIRVTTLPDCTWNATTDSSWISLSRSNDTGSGTVRYNVAANTATQSRSGVIVVAGQTHTVHQQAAAPPPATEERVDLSGRAFLVDGSCPNVTFFLDFRRVFTDAETKYKKKDGCSDVRSGVDVSVKGRVQSDGRVRATDIDVRN